MSPAVADDDVVLETVATEERKTSMKDKYKLQYRPCKLQYRPCKLQYRHALNGES